MTNPKVSGLRQQMKNKDNININKPIIEQMTKRKFYLIQTKTNLEKENKHLKGRTSKLSEKRAKLRQEERELQEKITSNQWKINDYNRILVEENGSN